MKPKKQYIEIIIKTNAGIRKIRVKPYFQDGKLKPVDYTHAITILKNLKNVPVIDKDPQPHDYWYYFGKCVPYPMRIKMGTLPVRPYKKFKTKEECQDYISGVKK